MPKTFQSIVVKAPINTVWDKIKNFHDMSWTPNVITSCEAVGDVAGTEVGAKRILNQAFHETLTELNLEAHTIKYAIVDGPSPVSKDDVKNYIGVVQLKPDADSDSTLVEWSSSWESNSEDAVEFCHGIYVALLNDLAASFR